MPEDPKRMHANPTETSIASWLDAQTKICDRVIGELEDADPKDGPVLYRQRIGTVQNNLGIAHHLYATYGGSGDHPLITTAQERLATCITKGTVAVHAADKKLAAWENAGVIERLRRWLGW